MIDPTLLAVATGLIGATGAMIWSYLMASKVAAPRAAAKSRLLLVNILTGATEEDKEILESVRANLVRPEVERVTAELEAKIAEIPDPQDIEIPEIDYEGIAQLVGKHVEMQFRQVEAQQAKRTGEFLRSMGIDEALGELEAGAREEALQALGPQAQVAMEILNTKIPKKASLIEKTVMQFAKAQAAQLVQGQMGGIAQEAPREPVSANRGFGVR